MTSAQYHAHPAISRSFICNFAASRWKTLHEPFGGNQATRLGDIVHSVILDNEPIPSIEVVEPPSGLLSSDGGFRSKAAKDWRDEQVAAGRIIRKPGEVTTAEDDMTRIEGMVNALRNHPSVSAWLKAESVREQPIFWTDEESGLDLKCKPDWWIPDQGLLIDLKTTEDASPAAFRKSVSAYGYDIQDIHYTAGADVESWIKRHQMLFVVVQSRAPYHVAVYSLEDRFGKSVREQNRRWWQMQLKIIKQCQDSGDWREWWTKEICPIEPRARWVDEMEVV